VEQQYEKIYLINFGAKLNDSVCEEVAKELKSKEIEQVMIKVNLDLSKNPYFQCHEIVKNHQKYFLENIPFVVNLPGLPIAVVFLVNEITAITSHEPTIIFTSRDISQDGFFSEFKFKRMFNLSYEKNVTREHFKNGKL
jgi:hypothetical protein